MNISGNHTSGLQVAGLMNATGRNMAGMQVSGTINIAGGDMRGAQIGVVNFARHQKGFQFGLLNVADTSSGASVGLINIVRKNGIHSVSVSSNEIFTWNLMIKTGTPKFYTIIHGARNVGGWGFGKQYQLSDNLFLSPELVGLYQGSWDYTNTIARFNLNLTYKINKLLSVFAGPSFNVLYSDQDEKFDGYQLITERIKMSGISGDDRFYRWMGWSAGISVTPFTK